MAPVDEDRKYVHTNVFVMPCVTVIVPPTTPKDSEGQPDGVFVPYQVPADDYTTLRFNVRTRRSVPCNDEVLADVDTERATVDSRYRKIRNRANDYLIDRAKQRTELYSGIEGLNATQDACVTESMGPISDRTREHLGYTDTQIVAVRRLLLKAVRQVQAGGDPPGLARRPEDDITPAIRSLTVTIARQAAWQDLLKVK